MGTESEKNPQLTINDPVDGATLQRLGEIQNRRLQLGDMLLELEQEKVKILVEGRRLDDEKVRLFSNILGSRGLNPAVPVEIDPQTGKISLIKVNGGQQAAAPAPQAEAAQPPPAANSTPSA